MTENTAMRKCLCGHEEKYESPNEDCFVSLEPQMTYEDDSYYSQIQKITLYMCPKCNLIQGNW